MALMKCTGLRVEIVSAIVSCCVLTAPVRAAEIRPNISSGGTYRSIIIEGPIEAGDFDIFIKIVRENQGKVSGVWLFSPGGDFDEAIKIGRALRALELSSQAPMRTPSGQPECSGAFGMPKPSDPKNCMCASAAFFIHIGAVYRGGTYLAVHRPYIDRKQFANLPPAVAEKKFADLQTNARRYMKEMGVTDNVQDLVMNTPSDGIVVLDEQMVKTYFWGEQSAYRHEWVRSKCSVLSDAERARSEGYSIRLRQAYNHGGQPGLSKTEYTDLEEIQKKEEQETVCASEIERQAQVAAYERYFGVTPNDYASEDFSKWTDAPKYLGKSFYEVKAEENFSSDSFGSMISSLQRERTANAPAIQLYGYGKKVVERAVVFSASNPSPEFRQRLLKALNDAWGAPPGGNGTTEWAWEKPAYVATLKVETGSRDGPALILDIRGR
jgi:hypothetical protein